MLLPTTNWPRPRPGRPVYVAYTVAAGRSIEIGRGLDFHEMASLAIHESELTGALTTLETVTA